MARILIVEDEAHIAHGLKFNLELEGHQVVWLADGIAAKEALLDRQEAFDLLVLDLMLPSLNGLDLCRGLRRAGILTPILILTAKSQTREKIDGLQLGADDYVTKPFNLEELLTRVETLLRRSRWSAHPAPPPDDELWTFGEAAIDFARMEASFRGQAVKLTPLEFEIMRAFREQPGKVITREALLERAWGYSEPGTTRTVDNFILRLRRAFEPNPSEPRHLVSVRGAGYKFVP